jgi:threonine dehydratase
VDLYKEITEAEARIRPYIRETPLEHSLSLSQMGQSNVYLKLENIQHTGSFKLRGALNKLLSLTPAQREKGVVTASTGNHGAATAYALKLLGLQGIVFVPETASPVKLAMIQRLGATIQYYGMDGGVTEIFARRYAEEQGMTYISPYNDPQIIGGQGTIAVELVRQLNQPIEAVFVAVGGGGLISGIAGYLKAVQPQVKIIGCLPENSPVMAASIQAQEIVEMESLPTLSDGTAGGIEPGAITFELCQRLVDDYILVNEEEIKAGMRLCIEDHHVLVEGAAGVAVAAYLKQKATYQGQNVVIIICGANISLEKLRAVL